MLFHRSMSAYLFIEAELFTISYNNYVDFLSDDIGIKLFKHWRDYWKLRVSGFD